MAIVVEGEFDVQKLFVRGFKFTVGVMGSSLHLSQIALLARYCREIFLVFDGDEAGKAAADKMVEMSIKRQFHLYFLSLIPVILPKRIDPDEFIDKYGSDALVDLLRKSREKYEERFE